MADARYRIEQWLVGDLCSAYEGKGPKRLVLPRYQRTLVWNLERKQSLYESIRSGYPIGSLLLTTDRVDGIEEYYLVDGLQRSNAIYEYFTNPFRWLTDLDRIDQKQRIRFLAAAIQEHDPNITEDKIFDTVMAWLSDTAALEIDKGNGSFAFIDYVFRQFTLKPDVEQIRALIDPVSAALKELSERLSINAYWVPTIVYTGSLGDLPVIFEKLNRQGQPLSRYQVFAAAWAGTKLRFTDKDLRASIHSYYAERATDAHLKVKIDLNTLGEAGNEYTLFEYFVGASTTLQKNFPILFEGAASGGEGSIVFNLSTAIFDIAGNETRKELPAKVPENKDEYFNRLKQASSYVDRALKPILEIPGNAEEAGGYHADLQISAYTAWVYKQFFGEPAGAEMLKKNSEIVERQLQLRYLYDILISAWAGHGDSQMREVAKSSFVDFVRPVSKIQWEAALTGWFDRQMTKKLTVRAPIDSTSVLFLKYVYAYIKNRQELLRTYDGEHLIPRRRLTGIIIRDNSGLPISNVGNISFLKVPINRGKGESTLLEWVKDTPKYKDADEEQRCELKNHVAEQAILRSLEDLRFEADENDRGLSAAWFLEFSRNRFSYLRQKFYEFYGVE